MTASGQGMRSMGAGPASRLIAVASMTIAVGVLGGCGQGVRSTGAEPTADTTAGAAAPAVAVTCTGADAAVQERVAAGLAPGWDVVNVAVVAGGEGSGLAVSVRARKDDNFGAFVYGEGVLYAGDGGEALRSVGEVRFWPGERAEAPPWLSEAARAQALACVR